MDYIINRVKVLARAHYSSNNWLFLLFFSSDNALKAREGLVVGHQIKKTNLTKLSPAVKLLRSKFERGDLTRTERPNTVWEADSCFQQHSLSSFRTRFSRMKKEYENSSGRSRLWEILFFLPQAYLSYKLYSNHTPVFSIIWSEERCPNALYTSLYGGQRQIC